MPYGIGKDPTCFWIGDANKVYGVPEEFRDTVDFRFCMAARGGKLCPVVTKNEECLNPEAKRKGRKYDIRKIVED